MRNELREPDLVGTYACPDGDGPFPGVLALTGSDGGIATYFLDMLVPEGFACLAVAYHQGFRGRGLDVPPDMIELPLERIEHALRWLSERPEVLTDEGRVGVIGISKGGELALLAAATFPDLIGPVVAYTPSNCVWQGVSWTSFTAASTWSHNGEPLTFVPYPSGVVGSMSDRGMSVAPIYDKGLDNAEAVAEAAIKVELATGPILLVSGGQDAMWPAERMCELVVERMIAHGRGNGIRHLNYPDAGHMLVAIDTPVGDEAPPFAMDLGGTPEADAAAAADAAKHAIDHLRSHVVVA